MAVTSSNNLRKGSKGNDVLELQKLLNQNGYNLAEDGSFGGKTLAAVKDYQQKNGLKVDGIVGTNTWGKLTSASTGSTNTTSNASTTPSVQTSEATNSAYNKVQDLETQKPGAFTYETPQTSWQNHVQETLDKILNKEPFSYDLNGDALYQQYKDQYTTQGQMAMMDTMGQAAAATGGYGNSYAQSVGQQAYQGYLQQLNDKVPELYQLALNQYNQEKQDLKDLYALYTDMDDREYNRAWDKINMDYTLHGDETDEWWKQYESANSDYWTKYGYDYQLGRDAVTDKNTAYDQAIGMIGAGLMPNSALLSAAGISSKEAQAWVKEVKAQAAAKVKTTGDPNDDPEDTPTEFTAAELEKILSRTAVTDFTARIRTQREFARGSNPDNQEYKTYKDYVKGMLEKYESTLTDEEIVAIAQKYGLTI